MDCLETIQQDLILKAIKYDHNKAQAAKPTIRMTVVWMYPKKRTSYNNLQSINESTLANTIKPLANPQANLQLKLASHLEEPHNRILNNQNKNESCKNVFIPLNI